MRNFYTLTPHEAIRYFIHHDSDVIPVEKPELVNVSIIMPTSRTAPENKEDSIRLKNLINDVERELQKKLDKREVPLIMDRLKLAHEKIDYSRNLDTLVIYANDKYAVVTTLAIESKPEILIGKYFDTRPLFKAKQQTRRYYVLAISRKVIRLYELLNDKLVEEINNDDFPFENEDYYTTDKEKLAQDIFKENLIKEFFNISDKRFQKYQNINHFPLVLAGDIKMVSYYTEMMDDSRELIGHVHGNYIQMPIPELIEHVYPVVKKYNKDNQSICMSAIREAQSAGRLVSDYDEINRFAMQGNVVSLFIGENFSLKGKAEGSYLVLDKKETPDRAADELTLPIISYVKKNNGRVIFLDDDLLTEFQGMCLIKRFD